MGSGVWTQLACLPTAFGGPWEMGGGGPSSASTGLLGVSEGESLSSGHGAVAGTPPVGPPHCWPLPSPDHWITLAEVEPRTQAALGASPVLRADRSTAHVLVRGEALPVGSAAEPSDHYPEALHVQTGPQLRAAPVLTPGQSPRQGCSPDWPRSGAALRGFLAFSRASGHLRALGRVLKLKDTPCEKWSLRVNRLSPSL